MRLEFKSFLSKNKGGIAGIVIGLLLCVLMFTIGFWRTLLLAVLVTAGFLIGRACDRGGDVSGRVLKLLDKILPNGYR